MYKKTIKYKDYNDFERTETFYFNLSKAELVDLEWRTPGGLENYMKRIASTLDGQALADMFKMLIEKSYGVKSDDGRRFMKSEAILKNFTETEAYVELYMSLATDTKAASDFVNGIFPKELVEEAQKQAQKQKDAGISIVPEVAAPKAEEVPLVEGQVVEPTT